MHIRVWLTKELCKQVKRGAQTLVLQHLLAIPGAPRALRFARARAREAPLHSCSLLKF